MAVIFVVDASDQLRIAVAKNELDILLDDQGLLERDVPILFFANKMDLSSSMTVLEVSEALDLSNITDRNWTVQPCSAKLGQGIEEGLNWITKKIQNRLDK